MSRAALVQNGSIRLKVTSYSMYPMLAAGSFVVVQPKPPKNLRCGDIIVWDQGAYWITHRIVKINDHSCITKGDANWNCDSPVDFEAILGCVTLVEEAKGKWSLTHFPWTGVNWLVGKLSSIEASIATWSGLSVKQEFSQLKLLFAKPIRSSIKLLLVAAKLLSKIR